MNVPAKAMAAVADHGGSLGRARSLFPHAPEPWIDLSTGINPHSYPLFDLPATALTRLPEPGRARELAAIAAQAYGAPSPRQVVAAPGTQILLPRVFSLVKPGRALVLGPTYAEHVRAAALAGHSAVEVARLFRARRCRPCRRRQSEQSGRADRRPRRPACTRRDAAPTWRTARRRRSLHGCRPARGIALRRCRAGRHRRAALLRQVLRPCRRPARLRHCFANEIAERLDGGIRPVVGLGSGAGIRHPRARRSRLAGRNARAPCRRRRAARCAACRARYRRRWRHQPVPPCRHVRRSRPVRVARQSRHPRPQFRRPSARACASACRAAKTSGRGSKRRSRPGATKPQQGRRPSRRRSR